MTCVRWATNALRCFARRLSKMGFTNRLQDDAVYLPLTEERTLRATMSSMAAPANCTTSAGFNPNRIKHFRDSNTRRTCSGEARAGTSKVIGLLDWTPIASKATAIHVDLRPVSAATASYKACCRTVSVLDASIG